MTKLVNQPTKRPTRKLEASGLAGVVAIAILAGLDAWVPGLGDFLTEPVYAGVVFAVAWITGYNTKERTV